MSMINISNKPCHCGNTEDWADDAPGNKVPQSEMMIDSAGYNTEILIGNCSG